MKLRAFAEDGTGVAAVEAGILAPVFLVLLLVTVDFAFVFQARVRLAGLLTTGAHYAIQAGTSAVGSDGSAFTRKVAAAITLEPGRIEDIDVKLTFNGSSNAAALSDYYCVDGTALRRLGDKAASCANGTTAGRYVTIEATGSISSFFSSNPVFGRKIVLNDAVTVRIE